MQQAPTIAPSCQCTINKPGRTRISCSTVARSEVSRSSVIRWDAASSPEDSTPPSPRPSMPQLAKAGIRKLLQDSPSTLDELGSTVVSQYETALTETSSTGSCARYDPR